MKKLFYIAILLFFAANVSAKPYWYNATSLTGGGAYALDNIDGSLLADGDTAIVVSSGGTYFYTLDSDLSGVEDSPSIINPDSNPGTKSWVLRGVFGATLESINGTSINELSTDGTMAGNSDDAVPTEKAVVTYVAATAADAINMANNFYFPDSSEADQGVTAVGANDTIKDIVDTVGSSTRGVIFLQNTGTTTTYTLSTSEEITDNITLFVAKGAKVSIDNAITLTISKLVLEDPYSDWIDGDGTVSFETPISEIRPEWWGADPSDATDDAAQLQDMFDCGSGKTILLSNGTYKSSAALTINTKPFRLVGLGAEYSHFLFTGATSGFVIDTTAVTEVYEFRDLSILTDVAGGGTNYAIDYDAQDFSGPYGRSIVLTDIVIRGNSTTVDYWDIGVVMTNGWYAEFTRCHFVGDSDDYNNANYAIFADGQCVDVKINMSEFFYWQLGVYVSGTSEGWSLTNCTIVGGDFGVQWNTTAAEPLLIITGSHFNNYVRGISATNLLDAQFSNNNMYVDRSKGDAAGIAIELGCARGSIVGNSIAVLNTGNNAYGIYQKGDGIAIMGNYIVGMSTNMNSGVYYFSGADRSTCVGNMVYNATDAYYDAGANNVIAHNYPAGDTHTQ